MKIKLVEFARAIAFPGGQSERVLSMDNPYHARSYGLELDPRGFVRVAMLEGRAKGDVVFVGPMHVNMIVATAESVQTVATKK